MSRAGEVSRSLAVAAMLLIAMPAGASEKPPAAPASDHLFGPDPGWGRFREIAEADIARRRIDPESARITWLGGYYKGVFKPFLEGKVYGYIACGSVNAKNRMGGYTGATTFVSVIDFDRVLYAEIDRRAGGMIDNNCAQAIRTGLMPAAAASPAVAPSQVTGADAATSAVPLTLGMTLRAMPDGAYVSAVVVGGAAAAAGLKPGMVITTVNAIPLAGMDGAMVKVIEAAGPNATLTLVGGAAIELRGKP